VDEQRSPLTRVLGHALDASLRWTSIVGELAIRTFDLLASGVSELGVQVVSHQTQTQRQQLSSGTSLAPPSSPMLSPAAILLEGEAGTRAFGLFVVENNLPQQISTPVEVGPLVDPDGREIPSVLRFEPGIITLAPKQQVVAKVSADISRGLLAGVRYEAEMRVPGIPSARMPIIVRRKPTTSSKVVTSHSNRTSSTSKRRLKAIRGRHPRSAVKVKA
jgi:hypothetical protein